MALFGDIMIVNESSLDIRLISEDIVGSRQESHFSSLCWLNLRTGDIDKNLTDRSDFTLLSKSQLIFGAIL